VRRWLRILHRDIGYLAVGMTLIFSISGLALNHIHDWNPNYTTAISTYHVEVAATTDTDSLVSHVRNVLAISDADFRSAFRRSPMQLELFTENGTYSLDLSDGSVTHEHPKRRFLLFDFNYLHLNKGQDAWKWVADVFALALIFLALSGLVLVKGGKGWRWRGLAFTLLGLILPVLFILYYHRQG
jgi:hypothetical protein